MTPSNTAADIGEIGDAVDRLHDAAFERHLPAPVPL
jgi:hypothetical protein